MALIPIGTRVQMPEHWHKWEGERTKEISWSRQLGTVVAYDLPKDVAKNIFGPNYKETDELTPEQMEEASLHRLFRYGIKFDKPNVFPFPNNTGYFTPEEFKIIEPGIE